MEALSLHTGAHTVHWEYNTSCISAVKAQIITPIIKHVDIPVYFLLEKFYNGLYIPKYDNSSVMPEDVCTKPCSGPIISWSTKWMTGFILYPNSGTEHYQFMILNEFIVK